MHDTGTVTLSDITATSLVGKPCSKITSFSYSTRHRSYSKLDSGRGSKTRFGPFIISLSSRAIPLPKILVLLFVPLMLCQTLQYPRSELVRNLFDDLCTDHWLSLLIISVLYQQRHKYSILGLSFLSHSCTYLQGTVTPVAPGTKIVSSNVVRLSRDEVFSRNH